MEQKKIFKKYKKMNNPTGRERLKKENGSNGTIYKQPSPL